MDGLKSADNRHNDVIGPDQVQAPKAGMTGSTQLPVPGRRQLCSSALFEAGEEDEVVGHDRGPDVGLEVIKTAPGTASQAVSAFEA